MVSYRLQVEEKTAISSFLMLIISLTYPIWLLLRIRRSFDSQRLVPEWNPPDGTYLATILAHSM